MSLFAAIEAFNRQIHIVTEVGIGVIVGIGVGVIARIGVTPLSRVTSSTALSARRHIPSSCRFHY